MARTPSTMLELGTQAPDFKLISCEGKEVCLDDFKGKKALLVVFICNHCPYVIHINPELVRFAKDYQAKGVAVVAISSNDVENYPDDSPDKMLQNAKDNDYPFPYLYDESQEVAKAYMAACTPDLFLFDEEFKLVYRGQFDGSRPKKEVPVTGTDMRHAVDALLAGKRPSADQHPSLGCNIKWKPGNEPAYYN